MKIRIRQAVTADIPILRELIDASVRGLQTRDYTPSQIESALATVYGVDTQLIADGTYLVAEAEATSRAGHSRLRRLEQAEDSLWWRPMDGPRSRLARSATRRRQDSCLLYPSVMGPARASGA